MRTCSNSFPSDDSLNGQQFNTAITDITDRKRAEDALCNALDKSHRQAKEVTALLDSSQAVLQYREFKDSAKSIFNSCKNLIGAKAGYEIIMAIFVRYDSPEYQAAANECGVAHLIPKDDWTVKDILALVETVLSGTQSSHL